MPETATAPAPTSTPASSPAAAPTPATSAQAPASSSSAPAAGDKTSQPALNDAFSEIDRIIADTQQKAPKPPGAKRAEKNAGQPDTNGDPTKTQDKAKPEEKPATGEFDETKAGPKELRSAYQQRKSELKEAREKLNALESQLSSLKAKESEFAEHEKLRARFAEMEKRAQELDTEIKFANYERSTEYKEKYMDPFVNAYQNARNKVASLKVMERKNDLDEVVQQGRKATAEDFDAIMSIRDDGEAAITAEHLFGPMANLVLYHREKVQDLNGARLNAIEDYRKKGSERETQTAEQQKAVKEKLTSVFNEAKKIGVDKHPQWFKPEDGDEQGQQILEKGMADADLNFAANGNMDPAERAMRNAAMRNMAGAFPYVALKLHRATTKIAELEKELSEYKASEPTEKGQERGQDTKPKTAFDELDELDKVGHR